MSLVGIFALDVELVGNLTGTHLSHAATVAHAAYRAPVDAVEVGEVETLHRFAVVGEVEQQVGAVNACFFHRHAAENRIDLLRNPRAEDVLGAVAIGPFHFVFILQTLEHAQRPIVVAQGIVDFCHFLSFISQANKVEHLVFASGKDALNLATLHIAHHMCIGLVRHHDAAGVGEGGLRIGVHHHLGCCRGVDLAIRHNLVLNG